MRWQKNDSNLFTMTVTAIVAVQANAWPIITTIVNKNLEYVNK